MVGWDRGERREEGDGLGDEVGVGGSRFSSSSISMSLPVLESSSLSMVVSPRRSSQELSGDTALG